MREMESSPFTEGSTLRPGREPSPECTTHSRHGRRICQEKYMKCKMLLEKETKGALRFAEVDDKGVQVEQGAATIGTLYLRKSSFKDGKYPKAISVEVKPV